VIDLPSTLAFLGKHLTGPLPGEARGPMDADAAE